MFRMEVLCKKSAPVAGGGSKDRTVDEVFFLKFTYFIAPLGTTISANANVINALPSPVEVSHHCKEEILHSYGRKMFDKPISQSALGFSDVQLIVSLAR